MENFNLESYLSQGVERIVKNILKSSFANPKTSIFMIQYTKSSKKARQLRIISEKNGEHIPPFLIASITDQCNLHCKGCYARANHTCKDNYTKKNELTKEEWKQIFTQASELGIGFILLAGGEPLLRWDILETAGDNTNILFPIFTNGTMLEEKHIKLFDAKRNLLPIFSIEGYQKTTDARRGNGTYLIIENAMEKLKERGLLFGASITVSKENIKEVMSDKFIDDLSSLGCKGIIYVEYVPIDETSSMLAPDDAARDYMNERLHQLRSANTDMLFISFPGDEKTSGGCLAAGRGFFHINAGGNAEPCPFSPYSDTNLINTSLRDALRSPLFTKLKSEGILMKEHAGGCVLYEQDNLVKQLIGG